MLIHLNELRDYEAQEQDGLLFIKALPEKREWDFRERKITSAVCYSLNPDQIVPVDLGLPHGYVLDAAYKYKPIIHRYVYKGRVFLRTPEEKGREVALLGANKKEKERLSLLDKYPCLADPAFFYNHTLIFAQEAEKLTLLALIHLSTGELEEDHETVAVAEHFGLDYDP